MMRRMQTWLVAAGLAVTVVAGQEPVEPVRLAGGIPVLPALPGPTVVGWGEVVFHVEVDATGTVSGIRDVRTSEPFTTLVRSAVAQWRFAPARMGEETIPASVLVAAVYRPRGLHNTPVAGTPPIEVEAPVRAGLHPVVLVPPVHPPQVLGDAVVLVEALVDGEGRVDGAVVRSPASGFDRSALDAARQWRFDVSDGNGTSHTYAYLVFAFREPVVTP
jgi:TonB family protein